MLKESKIALDCPYCKETIYQPLSWFEKDYSTCPTCGKGLAAGQFAAAVNEIKQAQDACVDDLFSVQSGSSCCGKKSSCG
ncbi:hypothetical protein SAMN05660860_00406 [Geoalkalibacter ferrihydriticus]|uniref:Uncharacterized protein n=2 Tax=Geoalkalibacter ferrihydriticus TaxID=392333 RepID=A0A0C2DUH6_9BACT|nr:hypothetical protein [Geoalkalibacter ferrihydriticus]KIH77089.1 hypothetical protein GFER_08660 [Geoalkalibacter ferrihydriticus DSM 17813]SDL35036.1 hypothetical protein SAMN05660860_00406 [Geoalkalibacter ferrihydriticus]